MFHIRKVNQCLLRKNKCNMPAAKHLLMQRYKKYLYKCMALRIMANLKEKERNANKSITHTIVIMK